MEEIIIEEKKKKKFDKSFAIFIILDFFVLTGFFLTYGPINYFREALVTSAMTTQTHQYLAYIFYNDEMVNKVMQSSYVVSFKENTNTSEIKFTNTGEITTYKDEYDEQILKRDEGNDLYKLIEFDYNKNHGYLLVVYDPSRISLAVSKYNSKGGQTIDGLVKTTGAIAGINASGLTRNKSTGAIKSMGTTIQNGIITSVTPNPGYGRGLIGFNYDNVLVLTYDSAQTAIKNGMRDAVTFGPFLIMNGEKATMKGSGGRGYAPRTAIAQRKDGIVLLLVFDGRGKGGIGVSMVQLADILYRYGAYNASNLDGGGSSTMVLNGKVINQTGGWSYSGTRYVSDGWILK